MRNSAPFIFAVAKRIKYITKFYVSLGFENFVRHFYRDKLTTQRGHIYTFNPDIRHENCSWHYY
jgi:hypothetical protein